MNDHNDWPEVVAGERTELRRFHHEPLDIPWLSEAAQAIAGRSDPCLLETRLQDGDQAWWITADGGTVGALCGKIATLTPPESQQALIWTWLAIEDQWRAFGFGGASVPLLEQAAHNLGATLSLAPLPPDNGVALYFWLRLGYTPTRSVSVDAPDWPRGLPDNALWMQRQLEPRNQTTNASPAQFEE